jgi:hypothetical protein
MLMLIFLKGKETANEIHAAVFMLFSCLSNNKNSSDGYGINNARKINRQIKKYHMENIL